MSLVVSRCWSLTLPVVLLVSSVMTSYLWVIRIEICVGRATYLTRLGHGFSISQGALAPFSTFLRGGKNQKQLSRIVRGILRSTELQPSNRRRHLWLTVALPMLAIRSVA